ncbi:MAG: rod-binding protein [Rhizobiaceae bacterium]
MAVSLATDIVLDVAKSVGVEGLDAARAALARKASEVASAKTEQSYEKFESMVLGSFLQTMMPKDTESVYGGGIAGEMWQSMLAQQLGEVLAERGGIGIADRLLKDHYVEGETRVPLGPRADASTNSEADNKHLLSVAMVQEIQRTLARTLSGEDAGEGGKG